MTASGAERTVKGLEPRVRFPPLADVQLVRFSAQCTFLHVH